MWPDLHHSCRHRSLVTFRTTLISFRILTADSLGIAEIGKSAPGISAQDVLGPDLAGLRVLATLHPAATSRLVSGNPSDNTRALTATLLVTLILCAVAVFQLRRTQEIVQLRSDFVASVSHELKTPLAQISLFADTLASARDRPFAERQEFAHIISREAKRLGHLVDGVLYFAGMVRSSSATTPKESCVIGEEIRAALVSFQPRLMRVRSPWSCDWKAKWNLNSNATPSDK